MKIFLYKWLPIVFGCHCRSDRSFYWKGKQFPICARCTGELIGIVFCPISMLVFSCSPIWCLFLMVPMILDGSIQLLTQYESSNIKRVITGILFGYGLIRFFFYTNVWAFQYGCRLAEQRIK